MIMDWIEKLFHGFVPGRQVLTPERDVVPRSVLITPPRARTISTPLKAEQQASQPAPVVPARKPEPEPDFSDSGFGLVSASRPRRYEPRAESAVAPAADRRPRGPGV